MKKVTNDTYMTNVSDVLNRISTKYSKQIRPNIFIKIARQILKMDSNTIYFEGNVGYIKSLYKQEVWCKPYIGEFELSLITQNEDIATLLAIGVKYLGLNNKFAQYIGRVLKIDDIWTE